MSDLKVAISIKDTDFFDEFLNKIKVLMDEIEVNDYSNKIGISIKDSKPFVELKEFINKN